MKQLFNVRCFQGPVLAVTIGFLVLISPGQLLFTQATSANSFDGAYVPDTSRNNGAPSVGSPSPCPSTVTGLGQGLTVKHSMGKFLVGVQPVGALKITPTSV